jgi:hypothetical protein
MVQRVRATVPYTLRCQMPPPSWESPASPLVMVTSEMAMFSSADVPGPKSNTRSGSVVIPPASMIVVEAPAPVMVRSSVMSRSPVAQKSSHEPSMVKV